MELVPRNSYQAVRHSGGRSVYKRIRWLVALEPLKDAVFGGVAYGALDKVPTSELNAAAKFLEQRMRKTITSWKAQHGDNLQ